MTENVSKGYWSISELVQRMAPLAEWTKRFKPEQGYLRLSRKDYDLIRRWPKAAHSLEIEVTKSGAWYRGLELTYDAGPKRYQKPTGPAQVDLEEVL